MALPPWVIPFSPATPTLPPAAATNVYLILSGNRALLIDAGYNDPPSLQPLLEYVREQHIEVEEILLTHRHPDHAAGAGYLADIWDCPVSVHPADAHAVRNFVPAARLRDDLTEGKTYEIGGLAVTVLETPGHTPGHVSLWIPDAGLLFPGDVILGIGTTWIGPPDGHLQTYLSTLHRLQAMPIRTAAPGHGPVLSNPRERITYYLSHRMERERQILALLRESPRRAADLMAAIYEGQIPPAARPVAERTILGHLIKLEEEGRIHRIVDDRPATPLARITWTDHELETWLHKTSFLLTDNPQ
ncbi:MAG: MBL fold metallo-hydrolase [Alicyclobacillaceae bacterium]|nr:MBL fold metallo-hydrolase [Alicyclobacillaceae bacterium]